MKTKFYFTSILAVALLSAVSCSKVDQPVIPEDVNGHHVCKMTFNGAVEGYDNAIVKSASTKASGSSWNDGDVIYITFFVGTQKTMGEGTYSSTDGWSIWYDGDLDDCSNAACEVRFFVNPSTVKTNYLELNAQTEIYEAVDGTYSYDAGELVVNATLTPKVGRIRFKGTPNSVLYIHGVTVNTSYSCFSNLFTTSGVLLKTTVGSDGYTPYVYGSFTDADKRLILIGDEFAYTRLCASDVLNKGVSGYMTIPSKTSHVNWKTGAVYKVDDVEFKMVAVKYGTVLYLMAETETTEALYHTVNGTPSSSTLPVDNVSNYNVSLFIDALNTITQAEFRLPFYTIWQHCAKGGNISLGFTYSGSNLIDDVAWYNDNCSEKQPVKLKSPNELGLYDMSGNVSEMTSIYTNAYTDYQDHYGGSYLSSAYGCRYSSYQTSKGGIPATEGVGFRLSMTLPK